MRILSGTQPSGVLRIGNQINAAMRRADFVNVLHFFAPFFPRVAFVVALTSGILLVEKKDASSDVQLHNDHKNHCQYQ